MKDVLTQLPQRQPVEEPADNPSTADERAAKSATPISNEQTSRVLDSYGTAAVQQTSNQLLPGRSALAARPGKAKTITRPSTFRLAVELQDALKAVAEYNGLNMTDIVAESIWLHLQNFEWPPESDQLRQSASRLF